MVVGGGGGGYLKNKAFQKTLKIFSNREKHNKPDNWSKKSHPKESTENCVEKSELISVLKFGLLKHLT